MAVMLQLMFEVQCRLIQMIPDANIELCKQLLKASHDKKVSASPRDLQNILCCWIRSSCNVCRLMQYMLYTTPARHTIKSCRHHTHCAPTAPINTLPVDTTALLKTQHVKVVGKKSHWQAKCHSSSTTSPQASRHQPLFQESWKGERITSCQSQNREKIHMHTDLFIAAMDCRTVGDVHPKKMIIDNISSQQCNEVHTWSENCLQAPAVKAPPPVQCQDWHQIWREHTTPPSVPTAAPKTNQPRWSAHWPGPHLNQTKCLQWVSNFLCTESSM